MSLDFWLMQMRPSEVYAGNFTHNLTAMAEEAGLYKCLWRAPENGFTIAEQLIPLLEAGIKAMEADPERFKAHNPPNGWGDYHGFLKGCKCFLEACKEYPNAEIKTWR
jgi:hypothetical protein